MLRYPLREDAARGADKRAEGRYTHNQVMLHDVGGSGSALTNIETRRAYAANRRTEGGFAPDVCIQGRPEC